MPGKSKVPKSASLMELYPAWVRELKAQNRSANTISTYTNNLRRFCWWLAPDGDCETTVLEVSREVISTYFGWLYEHRAPESVATAHRSLTAFFRFCIEYDELEEGASPMRWIKRQRPIVKQTPILTDEQLRALLATCENGKSFEDRRNYAILRVFLSTGMRLAELCALQLEDVHLDEGYIQIWHGKGNKERSAAIGPRVVSILGKYNNQRRKHKYSDLPDLWLCQRGALKYNSLRSLVHILALKAGITGVHPHAFRHWFAHGYLSAGGQENALLQLAGWTDARMIHERYGASRARERAISEHHKLGIGERF